MGNVQNKVNEWEKNMKIDGKKIEGLVFDMDGLLLDSERIVQRSWELSGKELGIAGMGQQIYHTLGMNAKSRRRFFEEHIGKDFPYEEFQKLTSKYFYQITDTEGLPVKKGAAELLKYAKLHGYKTAVATSSSRGYAERVLTDAGLYPWFDGGVFGDMVKKGKPDPEIYLRACESISLNPENALAFEDAPGGIRSAVAAGLHTIMIPDLLQPTEEIKRLILCSFNDLEEVISFLEKDA